VLAGGPRNAAAGPDAGRAYAFFGGRSLGATADLTLTGERAGDQLGFAVSVAGDVNRDGFADVLVGAPGNDAAGPDAGRAYVYDGARAPDGVADRVLTGERAGDEF